MSAQRRGFRASATALDGVCAVAVRFTAIAERAIANERR